MIFMYNGEMGVVCIECMRGYCVICCGNFYLNDSTPSFPTTMLSSSPPSLSSPLFYISNGQISSVVLSLLLALSEARFSENSWEIAFLGVRRLEVISIIVCNIKGINMTMLGRLMRWGSTAQGLSRIAREGVSQGARRTL